MELRKAILKPNFFYSRQRPLAVEIAIARPGFAESVKLRFAKMRSQAILFHMAENSLHKHQLFSLPSSSHLSRLPQCNHFV
jgi:hypothetical protein